MSLSVALDIDPGIDDALAVALALRSSEIRLELVTTVAGNGPLEMTTRNALRVLHYLGAGHVPVAPGAPSPLSKPFHGALEYHGSDALADLDLPEAQKEPDPRPAHQLLFEFASAAPGERVVVATGPLTNIAIAFQRYPEMPTLLRELVIMGGAFGLTGYGTGNHTPVAEFNIWQDPEAAAIVFGSGARIAVVGLDVSNDPSTALDSTNLAKLRAGVTPFSRLAADLTGYAVARHSVCALHDPLALAVVLDRSLFGFAEGRVTVHTAGDEQQGRTILLAGAQEDSAIPLTAVAAAVEGARFKKLFLSRILED